MVSSISLALLTTYGTREFVRKRSAPPKENANRPAQMKSIGESAKITGAIKKDIVVMVEKIDDAPVISEIEVSSVVRPATYSIITTASTDESGDPSKDKAAEAIGERPVP